MPPSGDYLICIAPAAARATAKTTTMEEYTNFAGHFDGHGDALVNYRTHHPMEEVQGFTRSHWTLPSDEYCSNSSKRTYLRRLFVLLFIINTLKTGTKQKDGP
jgi:hypothetical protein